MNNHVNFERSGELQDLNSYPSWAQDMVHDNTESKRLINEHELCLAMRDATLGAMATRHFMAGLWPVIERFPGYMSMNLLKTRYGRSQGDNMARRWLVRNIRVEQSHADYWIAWAEGAGISRDEVLNGQVPQGTETLAVWCEEVSKCDTLAAGMIATNYAVEGATGELSQVVYASEAYRNSLPLEGRKLSLRWLQLHAAYDDAHPWEALEIVCALMGMNPKVEEVAHLRECIRRSYVSLKISLDRCFAQLPGEDLPLRSPADSSIRDNEVAA
ncbi:TenA family transcriptional regulator [Frateuria aurantia]